MTAPAPRPFFIFRPRSNARAAEDIVSSDFSLHCPGFTVHTRYRNTTVLVNARINNVKLSSLALHLGHVVATNNNKNNNHYSLDADVSSGGRERVKETKVMVFFFLYNGMECYNCRYFR